jgi:ribokinase
MKSPSWMRCRWMMADMTQHPSGRVVVLGSANMDLILRVTSLPRAGETVLGEDAVLRPGGKGANQAVAAALAGVPVWMAGCLGDDGHATVIRKALGQAGVHTQFLRTAPGRSSGHAVVLVTPDGENAIAVSPGANHAVTVEDVEALTAELRPGDVLLLQLELPVAVVERAITGTAGLDVRVILNLAPAGQLAREALDRVDVLVVNRSEAEYLLGTELGDERELPEAVRALRDLGPATVVLTAGGAGALFGDADGARHVPALPVDVVDTAGAGDAFVGVLTAELCRGRDVSSAVQAATRAGAAAVRSHGAQLTTLDLPPQVIEQIGR